MEILGVGGAAVEVEGVRGPEVVAVVEVDEDARVEDVETGEAAGRVEAVEETARPGRAWDDETSAIFMGGTLGLVTATMLTVGTEAFCLLAAAAGGTFDLLAAIMGASEVGKLWRGSNIRARRMLSSAAVRSLGLNPVDRLSRGLVEGVSWAVTY